LISKQREESRRRLCRCSRLAAATVLLLFPVCRGVLRAQARDESRTIPLLCTLDTGTFLSGCG